MTEYKTPVRRGRPTRNPVVEQAVTADEAPKVEARADGKIPGRRRRASVGGLNMKLQVPERPGYHRHWFNDVPGRLAMAHELAYDFVEDRTLKSDSPDTRIRRHVGTIDGNPLYAYLMETPLEEYERGQREKVEETREVDKAIAAGRDLDGRVENQYGHGSIR
ncbi:hypothetical protein [Sphingopyxis sp. JAI128]|uniref:hypothetical protein n=1 Tax=Sphingopyxis sp. JAI128 TaxID=2723066 RepID=UPI0016206009|nr:hypothetical protein [Sphingopyxis sp. JAI128]MBB6424953.1 hypothetical protein [Sphingopyxis sp. JAI128]